MNSRAMTLSVIMAGIAVFFVMSSVSSIEEDAKKKFGNEVTVLVAKSDIKEMDTIVDGMVEPRVFPRNFVEPAAIALSSVLKEDSVDYQAEAKRIMGKIAIVPIKKGDQLSVNKISEPSLRTGLAPQVTPGKRAITISVDEMSSVGKLIKPGDRVDMIAVVDAGNGTRESKVAKTLLQDVVILAVGRNITNNLARKIETDPSSGRPRVRSLTEYDGYSSVTVEVEPAQAQLLAAIMVGSSNKLILTLRNNDDTDRTNLATSRAFDAIGSDVRAPAAAPVVNGAAAPTNNGGVR